MQINIRTDASFQRELDALVRRTGLRTRTAAIKHAVHETLQRARQGQRPFDFRDARGVAGKPDSRGRFRTDEDLYRDGMP